MHGLFYVACYVSEEIIKLVSLVKVYLRMVYYQAIKIGRTNRWNAISCTT